MAMEYESQRQLIFVTIYEINLSLEAFHLMNKRRINWLLLWHFGAIRRSELTKFKSSKS